MIEHMNIEYHLIMLVVLIMILNMLYIIMVQYLRL